MAVASRFLADATFVAAWRGFRSAQGFWRGNEVSNGEVFGKEWPEEDYPTYANGPGYVISSDVADSIVSEFANHKLRLFKMEDVSMGMWVERFNNTRHVEYVHSVKFL